jgi:hypothetical protein
VENLRMPTTRLPLCLLLLFGCRDTRSTNPLDSSTPETDAPDSGETGTPIDWQDLPASCTAPTDLPADPVTEIGRCFKGQEKGATYFTELLDLEIDGDLVYGVGQGGLMIYDISEPAKVDVIGHLQGVTPESNPGLYRYHRVELSGTGLAAVTHRGVGLGIVDVSDPTAPESLIFIDYEGLEGMAWHGDRLYVTVSGEGLRVVDVSDPAAPSSGSLIGGLQSPWDLTPVVDGWTYAADNALGVVPIDVSDPDAPVVHPPIALDGAVLHVTIDGDWLYAATGGRGVSVMDRSDPAVPVEVARAETGGSAVMVSVSDGALWVADHEGVAVFDVSEPSAPVPIGREVTDQFALAVRASGDQAWVGDWNYLMGYQRGPGAGELDLPSGSLVLPEGGGALQTTITNQGGDTLSLVGATVDDPRVQVSVESLTLAPGESAQLKLDYTGGDDLDATLCLASNDPDAPVQEVSLGAGAVGEFVGQIAPDFTMTDLDGNTWRLSEHLGSPIFLTFFATW